MPAKLKVRAERKNAKREEKKRQIAESAIEALKELGYANTSLRDIAQKCDLSLGMLHYYFEDRTDLIIYCVRFYKQDFVLTITQALEKATDRAAVLDAFAMALAGSIVDDARIHRLWYDIRNQAMFDETFRPVVDEIETALIGIVSTAFAKTGRRQPDSVEIPYAMLDGVFRFFMQNQLGDNQLDRDSLESHFRVLLAQFL